MDKKIETAIEYTREKYKQYCQMAGGTWYTDPLNFPLDKDAVTILVDPLDLFMFFESEEQYMTYQALDKSAINNESDMCAPLVQIVFYRDTKQCYLISRYDKSQLALAILDNMQRSIVIENYAEPRHSAKFLSPFNNFEDCFISLDWLANGKDRKEMYHYRMFKKARANSLFN